MGDDEVEFDGVLLVEFPVVLPPWVGVMVEVMGIVVVKVAGWRFGPRVTPTEVELETTTETEDDVFDDVALLLYRAVRGSGTSV